jgi:hypothetical protein
VIAGLIRWWIPRLSAAHYLISLAIDPCRMPGSSAADGATGWEAIRRDLSKLTDAAIVAASQDRDVFTLSAGGQRSLLRARLHADPPHDCLKSGR